MRNLLDRLEEMKSVVQPLIDRIKRKIPKWKLWFPNDQSEVEVPRCELLLLVQSAELLVDAQAEIYRIRELTKTSILCGGCGKRYTYYRADDPKGEVADSKHDADCDGGKNADLGSNAPFNLNG